MVVSSARESAVPAVLLLELLAGVSLAAAGVGGQTSLWGWGSANSCLYKTCTLLSVSAHLHFQARAVAADRTCFGCMGHLTTV